MLVVASLASLLLPLHFVLLLLLFVDLRLSFNVPVVELVQDLGCVHSPRIERERERRERKLLTGFLPFLWRATLARFDALVVDVVRK